MDLERAVVAAWQATAEELPGVRAIVDHHRAEPLDEAMAAAMAKSAAKEHVLLAVMAGRAERPGRGRRPRGRGDRGAARGPTAAGRAAPAGLRRRPRRGLTLGRIRAALRRLTGSPGADAPSAGPATRAPGRRSSAMMEP